MRSFEPPEPDLGPFSATLAAFFFGADSFGSIILTLSNSASINFKVDS